MVILNYVLDACFYEFHVYQKLSMTPIKLAFLKKKKEDQGKLRCTILKSKKGKI